MKIKKALEQEEPISHGNAITNTLIDTITEFLNPHTVADQSDETRGNLWFAETEEEELSAPTEMNNIEEEIMMGNISDQIHNLKYSDIVAYQFDKLWNFFVHTNSFELNYDEFMKGHESRDPDCIYTIFVPLNLLIQFLIAIKNFMRQSHEMLAAVIKINTKELVSKNLTKFLHKVFDPNYEKAMILAICGHSNAGKSHFIKTLMALMQPLNGIIVGNRISKGFQRVGEVGQRYLRIYEEYKTNILVDFPELEGNGTQLRQNNATLDMRVNLTVLCIDNPDYSLTNEGKKLKKSSTPKPNLPPHLIIEDPGNFEQADIQRRINQVNNRIHILAIEKCYAEMIQESKELQLNAQQLQSVYNNIRAQLEESF